MPKIQINHRYSGAVLFECDVPEELGEASHSRKLRHALKKAVAADADLTDANLTGVNLAYAELADANLTDANLTGVNLTGADLTGVNLTGACLNGAYLTGANLTDANLTDANLNGAYLNGAYLTGVNLTDADLTGANLTGVNLAYAELADANLTDANLTDARNVPAISDQTPLSAEERAQQRAMPRCELEQRRAERYRQRNPDVPVIEAIDAKILQAVECGGKLEMGSWHACATTHCRAGWAITLAGDKGADLERHYGPAVAGRMIYLASAGYCPHFYASNEAAIESIRERAAEQTEVRS